MGHFVDYQFGTIAGSLATVGVSRVLGALFAFVMHRRFVFRVRSHVLRELLRFESVYLTALGINAVALPVLVELPATHSGAGNNPGGEYGSELFRPPALLFAAQRRRR